ncbi:hypothetical protein D1AOALGA4SA_6305 [Olavius algarvensis Delta 1 endosymbiont]|nr:hypothetical protein D1AOALGA4SA_6305 [Olavius algarvensis Delta 1 endosymbiont]
MLCMNHSAFSDVFFTTCFKKLKVSGVGVQVSGFRTLFP